MTNNYFYKTTCAEREGFEPSVRFWRTHAFQACLFSHSSTSPYVNIFPAGTNTVFLRNFDAFFLFMPNLYPADAFLFSTNGKRTNSAFSGRKYCKILRQFKIFIKNFSQRTIFSQIEALR